MNTNELANAGIVTQLAMVHTMLPKVKELIDQQLAEIEALKKELYFKEYYEELPDTPVGLLENFKPVWKEKSAVRELTNEEIGEFTHRMVLCCQVHPSSADINVLGLAQIVEEIRKL